MREPTPPAIEVILAYQKAGSVSKFAIDRGCSYSKARVMIKRARAHEAVDGKKIEAFPETVVMDLYRAKMNDAQISRRLRLLDYSVTEFRIRSWRIRNNLPVNVQTSKQRSAFNQALFSAKTGGAHTIAESALIDIITAYPDIRTMDLVVKSRLSYNYVLALLRRLVERKLVEKDNYSKTYRLAVKPLDKESENADDPASHEN